MAAENVTTEIHGFVQKDATPTLWPGLEQSRAADLLAIQRLSRGPATRYAADRGLARRGALVRHRARGAHRQGIWPRTRRAC